MSLLDMSIAGGVVILAVTAVRTVCVNRLPKGTFLALWAVALLRLLVPVSVPSPVSVYRLLDNARPAAESIVQTAQTTPAPAPDAAPAYASPTPAPDTAPDPIQSIVPTAQTNGTRASIPWLTLLWAAGAAGCGAYFVLAYITAMRRFREAVPVQDPDLDRWRDGYGLRRRVSVRLSGRVKAPVTYGLIRPVILLSADVDWHDRQRMWLILCHEYAHIRRLDGLKKLILAATACLHWFNPLVWVMYMLANRDIELACDEQVLRAINGDGRADYARTLLDMVRTEAASPLVSHFAASAMAERVKAIMKAKKPTALTVVASVLLTLGVTAVFAAGAPNGKAPAQAAAPAEAQASIIHRVSYTPPSPSPAPVDPEATERPRPTEDEVLAARKEALTGMTQEDIDRLTSVITYQNQRWENMYLDNILTRLEDPEDLSWNYFEQTGEIRVSCETSFHYYYDGELTDEQIVQVMKQEGINYEQFYEKYGVLVEQTSYETFNTYSVDEIVSMLDELRGTVRNEDLRTDLAYLSNQIVLSKKTHNMWYVNNLFKMLHDLDYYLLRYGPQDQPSTRPGEPSIVGVYYGMLTILGADHGEGIDPYWAPASPPSPTPGPAGQ